MIPLKRSATGAQQLLLSANRYQGSGGGSGLYLPSLGYAAGGNQGNYSTANSSTWADITNTSFNFQVDRPCAIEYRIFFNAHLSVEGALGYVRGNIVGYDTSASPSIGTAQSVPAFIWYMALQGTKGPIQPGVYTAKLQAATDNNTFSITVDGFFHQVIQLS